MPLLSLPMTRLSTLELPTQKYPNHTACHSSSLIKILNTTHLRQQHHGQRMLLLPLFRNRVLIRDAPLGHRVVDHLPLCDSVTARLASLMDLSVRPKQAQAYVCILNIILDSSAQIVEAIWPLSSVVCRGEMGAKGVLPLRTFIQETLRRSRTSYSTLQVALYYLILIKAHVPKHDFTMEQPEEGHGIRALRCGRRMFLAALILASKYLQDRNYSARAWSKICGLNAVEINQNETAFLLAVNWKLHITEAVFQKWADIMLRFTSNKPGGPGSIRSCSDTATWKAVVVQLTPGLDNLGQILASSAVQPRPCKPTACFAKPVFSRGPSYESGSSTPTPATCDVPQVLGPNPFANVLPTPRMTPAMSGYSTPAVGAMRSAMGLVMFQASAQTTERWQTSVSPPSVPLARRSPLATSSSSVSSPESMVSDSSSRSSRSSSVSSASSVVNAPVSSKLDVQARYRFAKQFATVHENYVEAESPPSYLTSKGFNEMSLPTPEQSWERDCFSRAAAANDAAFALQELHDNPRSNGCSPVNRAGIKRSRTASVDHSLQENVREILHRSNTGTKRVCCPTEYAAEFQYPNVLGRPGGWAGILN